MASTPTVAENSLTGAAAPSSAGVMSAGGRVVDTILRLRPDGNNAAVAKQVFDDVNAAVRNSFKEMETLGGNLRTKAGGWAKSIGASMSSAWHGSAKDHAQATDNILATIERQKRAAKELVDVTANGRKRRRHKREHQAAELVSDLMSDAHRDEDHKAAGSEAKSPFEESVSAGSHGLKFAKNLALLTAPNEKIAEERKKTFEKLETAYGVVEEGVGMIGGVKKAFSAVRGAVGATKAGQKVVGAAGTAAKLAGAVPAAAEGVETVGAVGGIAGIGTAATIGGAVVGGLLLVDGFKKVGNSLGILGGHFETLTGAVMDWYGSVQRSAELEKQITGLEEAHKAFKEQMKERQEHTRAYYEGRDRIDEARQFQQQAARLTPFAEHFEKRLGDVDKVRTPRELEQLQHAAARDDQQFAKKNYDSKFGERQQELHQAVEQANATLKANLKPPTKAAVTFLGQPTVHNSKIDAEGQKKIDEQEAEYVPEGFLHGLATPYRKVAGWFGKSEDTDQRLAGLELRNGAYEQKAINTTVPVATPQAVDLQPQLSQQERALKLANQLRDVTRDRTTELQNQLQAMNQQVMAAKQQKLAAEQQVKAEQERAISQKAGMSMMTKGQQSTAAAILRRFNQTKHFTRDDALTLQKLGINQGAIGKGINETLAQGLDAELAKQFKAAGGEEELDKAQQRLTQSTSDLAEAQAQAKDTLQEFREALAQFKDASATAESAQDAVESTRSKIGGYQDPTGGRGEKGITEHRESVGGEKVKLAIEGARKDFIAAIHEIGDSVSAVIGAVTAEARGTAQRIKQSQQ